MFCSVSETRTGQCGTAFIISSKLKRTYLGFEPLVNRMCKIRLKGCFRHVSFISAYASTEDESDVEKNAFYDRLHKECSKAPKYDMSVLLGDFNEKVRKEDFLQYVAGKHSLHTNTNENRKVLCHLPESDRLIIKSTCLTHIYIYVYFLYIFV